MQLDEKFEALPDWCTVTEACRFLSVSRSTVLDMVRSDELAAWRRGAAGRWRISKDSIGRACGLVLPEREARDGRR